MTDYKATRADQLRAGDVVAFTPYHPGEVTVVDVSVKGRTVWLTHDIDEWPETHETGVIFQRLVAPEEYERLSAPEDW